jgi:hypothetical protein
MNEITRRWVGIDVAELKGDVAALDERGKVRNRVFASDRKGFEALIAWLADCGASTHDTRLCLRRRAAGAPWPGRGWRARLPPRRHAPPRPPAPPARCSARALPRARG